MILLLIFNFLENFTSIENIRERCNSSKKKLKWVTTSFVINVYIGCSLFILNKLILWPNTIGVQVLTPNFNFPSPPPSKKTFLLPLSHQASAVTKRLWSQNDDYEWIPRPPQSENIKTHQEKPISKPNQPSK